MSFTTTNLVGVIWGIAFLTGYRMFLSAANTEIAAASRGGHGGSRGEGAGIKWSAFVMALLSGGGFAVGLLLPVTGLISWLNERTDGWLSSVVSVAVIAIGWWAVYGVVAAFKDLLDGVPDKEAFRSAVLIPTTVPLGFGALWAVFTDPQGFPTRVAAVVLSLIGGYFMHKILTLISKVGKGKKFWSWLSVLVCVLVGIMHTPALFYLNDLINSAFGDRNLRIGFLDVALADGIRSGLAAAAVVITLWAAGDLFKGDKLPGRPTWWAGMYAVPTYGVYGVLIFAGFSTTAESVFQAFS